MKRRPILLVEDEIEYADLIKMHLEAITDFEVFLASDGKTGLKLARDIQPLVILLDIILPEMDGYEVLKNLKENQATSSIPVIMLSALGDKGSKEKAAQLFDEDYIVKPTEAKYLKEKIEEVIARRGSA